MKSIVNGTLVRIAAHDDEARSAKFLYGGDEKPWEEEGVWMLTSDIAFGIEDVGIVIDSIFDDFAHTELYKIIVPSGVGWARRSWIELVKD